MQANIDWKINEVRFLSTGDVVLLRDMVLELPNGFVRILETSQTNISRELVDSVLDSEPPAGMTARQYIMLALEQASDSLI